jgi:hypothetical protein
MLPAGAACLQQQQTLLLLLLLLLLLMLATRGTLACMLVACLCRSLGLNPSRQQSGTSQQLLQVLPMQQQQVPGWASQLHSMTASKTPPLLLLLLLKVVVASAHRGV